LRLGTIEDAVAAAARGSFDGREVARDAEPTPGKIDAIAHEPGSDRPSPNGPSTGSNECRRTGSTPLVPSEDCHGVVRETFARTPFGCDNSVPQIP